MNNDLHVLRREMLEAAEGHLAGDVMIAGMDTVTRALEQLNSRVAWEAAATAFEMKAGLMRLKAGQAKLVNGL